MEIRDQSKGYFKTRVLVEMVFKCSREGVPAPDQLNTLLQSVHSLVQPLKNAHTESWVLEEISADSFPPSKVLQHPLVALGTLMELVEVMKNWVGAVLSNFPVFFGLKAAAVDLGTIQQRLLAFRSGLPSLLESEELKKHCEECDVCRTVIEDLEKAKEERREEPPPEGAGGMSN